MEMRPRVSDKRYTFDTNVSPASQYVFLDKYCERYYNVMENDLASKLPRGHENNVYYMRFNVDYEGMYVYDKVLASET